MSERPDTAGFVSIGQAVHDVAEECTRRWLERMEPAERKATIIEMYMDGRMSADDAAFWFYVFGIGGQ